MSFLNFLDMASNYEQRKVANYTDEEKKITVDTCMVTDSQDPFETGISCPLYNNGEWVIVETYKTREEAQEGHEKWVKKMTGDILPEMLVDVSTASIAKLCDIVHNQDKKWRSHDKQ